MKRVWIIPSCEDVHAGITEFTEGALSPRQRLGFRLHFLLCAACRSLLAAFRDLPKRVRRALAPEPAVPPEAKAVLHGLLQNLKESRLHPPD